MAFLNYFKWSFQYKHIFSRLTKPNVKIIVYFLLISMMTAFPLNYQILREDGFRLDFIAQSFSEDMPRITIPECSVSAAGMDCVEDFSFAHDGITYYVNYTGIYDVYESPAIIMTESGITYLVGDYTLYSDGYQGFGDRLALSSVNYGTESDNALVWEAFGFGVEQSFNQYIVFYTLGVNVLVQLFIQTVFVVFLMIVLRLFHFGLSTFMTIGESFTFIVWMMTMPAVVSIGVAFIEPVFANVMYQLLVGVSIMVVMLKYGRKFYQ